MNGTTLDAKPTNPGHSKVRAADRNRFLLVGNASYLNRGCEAILRGTVKILRNAFGECQFVNANFDVTDPPHMPVESDPDISHQPLPTVRKLTARWAAVKAAERLYPQLGHHMRFGNLREGLRQSDAALSIGGDNYTLDYGIPWKFVNLDRYVLGHSRPLAIWGASIGPFDKNPEFAGIMHEHLKREVTAIFVREKRSYDYLLRHGIADNVYLMSDPAFLMDTKPVASDRVGFEIPEDAVGFNLSPLMAYYVGNDQATRLVDVATDVVDAVQSRLRCPVVLIPHVTSPHSNDHELLKRIHERLAAKGSGRAFLLPDTFDAEETKWAISQLSCLVAARTHATIAAFSTCVPTVSLAYSVKAFGINEELFGHTDFVVGPEEFSAQSIIMKIEMALARADEIRNVLHEKMSGIRASALAAGAALKESLAIHHG